MDDEDRGRTDLIAAILRVLPINLLDGTTVIRFDLAPYGAHATFGDPRVLARRILDSLDEAYKDRDLRGEWNYMVNDAREEHF